MPRPHGLHGLKRHAFCLRQEHHDEDGHGLEPRGVEQEDGVLHGAEQRDEHLQLHEGDAERDGDAQGLPGRPDLHGVDLMNPCYICLVRRVFIFALFFKYLDKNPGWLPDC